MTKKQLRQKLLTTRVNQSKEIIEKQSESIISKLQTLIDNNSFDYIFAYKAFKGEVSLDGLISKLTNIALPKICPDKELQFYKINFKTTLIQNKWGVLEPEDNSEMEIIPTSNSLILVPALAFDKLGYRLGFGGGFYDRFLKQYPKTLAIGVCGKEFLLDTLPRDSWDQSVFSVYTD